MTNNDNNTNSRNNQCNRSIANGKTSSSGLLQSSSQMCYDPPGLSTSSTRNAFLPNVGQSDPPSLSLVEALMYAQKRPIISLRSDLVHDMVFPDMVGNHLWMAKRNDIRNNYEFHATRDRMDRMVLCDIIDEALMLAEDNKDFDSHVAAHYDSYHNHSSSN